MIGDEGLVLSAFIQLDIYRTWSLLNSHTVFRKRLMDFVSSPSRKIIQITPPGAAHQSFGCS
jgi:hypothetical protein